MDIKDNNITENETLDMDKILDEMIRSNPEMREYCKDVLETYENSKKETVKISPKTAKKNNILGKMNKSVYQESTDIEKINRIIIGKTKYKGPVSEIIRQKMLNLMDSADITEDYSDLQTIFSVLTQKYIPEVYKNYEMVSKKLNELYKLKLFIPFICEKSVGKNIETINEMRNKLKEWTIGKDFLKDAIEVLENSPELSGSGNEVLWSSAYTETMIDYINITNKLAPGSVEEHKELINSSIDKYVKKTLNDPGIDLSRLDELKGLLSSKKL